MYIAIINSLDCHFESIAFLLEKYKNTNIDVYLKSHSDKYKWIDYYKTLYKFKVIYDNFSNNIINNYNKIFKITSSDNYLSHKKIISILHLKKKQKDCKSEEFISLTPYINGKNISYIFPLFKPVIHYSKNKIITLIGYYLNKNIDFDTQLFIKQNNDYLFNFVTWGDSSYSNLTKFQNVKVYRNVQTRELVNIINTSKYILSKKYINYDRFSGQLGLAMSFEKPMIIDKKTAESYKLPGFMFDKNYSEIGKLSDISDERYDMIVDDIRKFNNILQIYLS